MKLLIVGGAGYLGSIVGDVLEAEHVCYHFDRKLQVGKARSVVADATERAAVCAAVREMDAILYMPLGVRPGTRKDISDPVSCFHVHVLGFYNFVREGLRAGVRRFIYVSSLEVYRERMPEPRPLMETSPSESFEPYGLSKRLGELVALAAVQQHSDATVVSVRICYPRHDDHWPPQWQNKSLFKEFALGPDDTRRLFRAVVGFERPGLHFIHASGDVGGKTLSNARAFELLGWKPQGR